MAKFQSPLLGYNNNVRHRGRVFHVQTEDSGVAHPHIITHLFMDGGRILKSVKRSYADLVGTDDMSDTVRALMKEQHKAMVIALRDGEFDAIVEGKPAASPPSGEAKKAPAKPPEPKPQESPAPEAKKPDPPPAPKPRPAEDLAPATVHEHRDYVPLYAEPPLPPELEALLRDELPPGDAPAIDDAEPPTRREPPPAEPTQPELTLDFDALERDAGPSPVVYRTDLPPPPDTLFAKERRTGEYRTLDGAREEALVPKPASRPPPKSARPPNRTAASPRPPSVRPPRPTSPQPPSVRSPVTGTEKKPRSLFADESVRDKSLDEVILSYLADDLDPPPKT